MRPTLGAWLSQGDESRFTKQTGRKHDAEGRIARSERGSVLERGAVGSARGGPRRRDPGTGDTVLESGTHRLSRRAASHAESWLPGRPGSRVAGNREGERLKRGGGRGLAEWTLIVHRGSNSSVIPRSLPLWLICTSSLLRALAKPCRASAVSYTHLTLPTKVTV